MKKVIISAAVTGGQLPRPENENKPMTPKQIADEVVLCAKAGAAICHIHARNAEGRHTNDINVWREIDRETRKAMKEAGVDVVLNYTTSAGAGEARYAHVLELHPEICSYDAGTLNWTNDTVFRNSPGLLRDMGIAVTEAGVKPEIEIFDEDMIKWTKRLLERGCLKEPLHFQLMLGTYGGAEATVDNLVFLRNKLPEGCTWSVSGIGKGSLPMIMAALAMGADGIRVGLEDNLYMDHHVLADNVGQVERAAELIKILNYEVATAADAREMLHLQAKEQ